MSRMFRILLKSYREYYLILRVCITVGVSMSIALYTRIFYRDSGTAGQRRIKERRIKDLRLSRILSRIGK